MLGTVRIELTCGVLLLLYIRISRVLVSDADSKDPKACKALVDGGHVYLDVRTDDEVSQGAPVDCVNVPAFARTDDGMMPMSSTFLKLVSVAASLLLSRLLSQCAHILIQM